MDDRTRVTWSNTDWRSDYPCFLTYFGHLDALWSKIHFTNFTSCETQVVLHCVLLTHWLGPQLQNKVADNVNLLENYSMDLTEFYLADTVWLRVRPPIIPYQSIFKVQLQ